MLTLPDASGPLHTPAEMQQISDLAHWIEGGVLMLAAALALWGSVVRLHATRAGSLDPGGGASWATVLIGAGLILILYLVFPHHGLNHAREQWEFVFGDSQQRQHVVIAGLMIVGAAAEVLYRTNADIPRITTYMWPASVFAVGLLFAVHTQHGTSEAVARAVAIHRALGSVFIGAAAIRAAELVSGADVVLTRPVHRWLVFGWPVLLVIASVLLMSYREPAGAYEADGAAHGTAPQNSNHGKRTK